MNELSRRRQRKFGFPDVNGVLAPSMFVPRPEIKLVSGFVRPNVINQRVPAHAIFRFGNVKRKNGSEPVVLRDEESWFAFSKHLFTLSLDHHRNILPATN